MWWANGPKDSGPMLRLDRYDLEGFNTMMLIV